MEEGFIPDRSYAQVLQLVWQRGEPEPLKFFGMSSGSIGLRKEDDLNVTANLNTVLGALAGGLGHHTVDYRVYGQVHLQGGMVRTLAFDQKGRVRL